MITLSVAPMSTFRQNISRMLMSTNNQSRIVDISHEDELKRGVTTSGVKADFNDEKTTMKDSIKESVERTAAEMNDAASKASRKSKDTMQRAADTVNKTGQSLADKLDDLSNKTVSRSVSPNQAMPAGEGTTRTERFTPTGERIKQERIPDGPIDWQHIQPGTMHLKRTNDGIDEDPAVSIKDMENTVRETKEELKGAATSAAGSAAEVLPESVVQAGEAIKDAVKGAKRAVKDAVKSTPLHDMGHNAKVKAKEILTGEKEKVKPNETKSEVRTKGWADSKQRGSSHQ
jgi:cell division septum initiation protein DivIVA